MKLNHIPTGLDRAREGSLPDIAGQSIQMAERRIQYLKSDLVELHQLQHRDGELTEGQITQIQEARRKRVSMHSRRHGLLRVMRTGGGIVEGDLRDITAGIWDWEEMDLIRTPLAEL